MGPGSRRGRLWAAAPLMVAIVGSVCGNAQVRVVRRGDDRLRGIRSVDVLVNGATDVHPRCRIEREPLQRASVEALQATGLRATVSEKASSWFYTVELDVRSVAAGDHCVSTISADLVAHIDGVPEADRGLPSDAWGSLLVGTMRLVRETALVAALPADHAERVTEALRRHLTAIGERIRRANGGK